jgi:hypothetical protein
MSEGLFTWKWVRENLTLPRPNDVLPGRDACERIAAEFNHAVVDVEIEMRAMYDPLPRLWAASRKRWGEPEPTHPAATVQSSKDGRLWARHVLAMGEVVRKELDAVNKNRKPPFGFRGKPSIPLLEKAFPMITLENPSAGAIEKELERQRPAD